MCAKILETSGKLNMDEYNFFLRGGVVSWSVRGHFPAMGVNVGMAASVGDSRVRAQDQRLPR